jgi:hypothetical protein
MQQSPLAGLKVLTKRLSELTVEDIQALRGVAETRSVASFLCSGDGL